MGVDDRHARQGSRSEEQENKVLYSEKKGSWIQEFKQEWDDARRNILLNASRVVKLSPCRNVLVEIHVTGEMLRDYESCRMADGKDCDGCGWDGMQVTPGVNACELMEEYVDG